jgi:nitrate/TMAO reductase-like tetraheme cytochrome c subunit
MTFPTMPTPEQKPAAKGGLGAWLRRRWQLGMVAMVGMLIGGAAFASWITVIEYTNHTEFCITCHVMKDTVYQEYTKSSHFSNKFGAHAGCPDCHVPQYSWYEEAKAKIGTAKELYAFFFQGMSNVETFEKARPQLAKDVWAKFEATNARECRHCHDYSNMISAEQAPSARAMHDAASIKNENCVNCHKGITHKNYAVKAETPDSDNFDVK